MNANKYKLLLSQTTEKEINIPIEINWDFLGRSHDIDRYEEKTVKEVLNLEKDFEVARFSHNIYKLRTTEINYQFFFVPTGSGPVSWSTNYEDQGFTPKEIYYFANSFKRSFFKLDFYDSPSQSGQTNYFTVILPTQQGVRKPIIIGTEPVEINTPVFKLDYIGDKEGFFIYWLKKTDFINKNIFFMTAKFFDAKQGTYTKMMNRQQKDLGNLYNFPPEKHFYYKVVLDYNKFTYEVFDVITSLRVGLDDRPINWYEYVNPS